jgi:hypothetical protein
VPFLLLFHGNVLAAGSAVLSLAYAGWVAYVFAIARRYLPRLQAAAATAATVSFPAFVVYDLIFNTEGAWLFAAFGWLYHSLASEEFRRKRHAALAGLLLGLAVMLRPAETSLMVPAYAGRSRNASSAKEELGLDHCEARSWHGWHRHMTLCMAAGAFLARLQAQLRRAAPGKPNKTSPTLAA